MSIYSTLWQLRFPTDGISFQDDDDPGILIIAQAVPPHIQDDASWLPPPIPESSQYHRAVVITTADDTKGTKRSGQEYANPLLVLTGTSYASLKSASLRSKKKDSL